MRDNLVPIAAYDAFFASASPDSQLDNLIDFERRMGV